VSTRQGSTQGLNVAIGGPQGVGKSTVLRMLASGRPDFETISVGDQFPADFRALSDVERALVRHEASDRLSTRLRANQDRVLLVDLHYLDLRETVPRIQRSDILDLFDLHVLLSLPANVLLARRTSDPSREDRSVSIVDAERDLAAHLRYFRDRAINGQESLVLDCQKGPEEVAEELQRHIDAGLTRSLHR